MSKSLNEWIVMWEIEALRLRKGSLYQYRFCSL